MTQEHLLTIRQVAQRFQVSEEVVLDWLNRGELRGVHQGPRIADWRVSEGALRRFTDSRNKETERD